MKWSRAEKYEYVNCLGLHSNCFQNNLSTKNH
nr:MAG TPA: Gallinacin-11 fold, double-beta-defensin, defensin, avian [Caudoviricetes sp.]